MGQARSRRRKPRASWLSTFRRLSIRPGPGTLMLPNLRFHQYDQIMIAESKTPADIMIAGTGSKR
jgi:hypothetical protein